MQQTFDNWPWSGSTENARFFSKINLTALYAGAVCHLWENVTDVAKRAGLWRAIYLGL